MTNKIAPNLTREVPNAIEIEQAVLGALISKGEAYFLVNNILTESCFYKPENHYIYKAIHTLSVTGKPVDMLTVIDYLQKANQLDMVGGYVYINQLTNAVASTANLEAHSYILREKAIKRAQIDLGHRLVEKGFSNTADPLEVNDWATDEVFKMATLSVLSQDQTNEAVAKEIMEEIYAAAQTQGLTGLRTGYKEQDEVLGGYQAPNLIIWAARPGMGKTAKMLSEAYYMAVVLDIPVLIFSMEMSRKELIKRLAVIHSQVGSWIYRQKTVNEPLTRKFETELHELAHKKIIIDDTPAISPEQMRTRAKKEIAKNGIKIVFADYLQLMTGRGDMEATRISYCSRKSKALAKELEVPVVMLAQVNRETAKRGGGSEPQLTDLKGSGSIEEDADIIGFIHRPPYYQENAKDKKQAYFIIAKHRNGSLARIESRFLHDKAQFVDPGEDVIKLDEEDKKNDESKNDNLPF